MEGQDKKHKRRYAQSMKARMGSLLWRVRAAWGKLYGPWERTSARFLDSVAQNDQRRRVSALVMAVCINVIVLTAMSVFARVRIWIPNAPSGTINVTLVEVSQPEMPLRDPDLFLEPEPEPEIVEDPEPEIEPVPDPEPEPEIIEEPEPEPELEPEPEPEPPAESEPELNLDLSEPQFAPPADSLEPLIPDPALAAEDDLSLPAPEKEPQTAAEEDPDPLISVEPEARQEAGLEDIPGDEDSDGEDAAGTEDETDEEERRAEEPPQNDDMFDEEPVFSGRHFVMPRVELPQGEAPAVAGSSGVVAIFCPEQFSNEDKAKECAGRRELRSGWRPGDSGEDWTRATALLKGARERGEFGPSIGPTARELERARDERLIRDVTDPRRSQDSVNNLPDAGDDNIMRGVEGNRPSIGPAPFEPGWTRRDQGELTQKELDEIKKAMEEAEENK